MKIESFAALNNIGADQAASSLEMKMACLTAPFIGLDGINEKGVSVAVLTATALPWNSTANQKVVR